MNYAEVGLPEQVSTPRGNLQEERAAEMARLGDEVTMDLQIHDGDKFTESN